MTEESSHTARIYAGSPFRLGVIPEWSQEELFQQRRLSAPYLL